MAGGEFGRNYLGETHGITRTQKTEEPEIKPEVGTEEVSEAPKTEEAVIKPKKKRGFTK